MMTKNLDGRAVAKEIQLDLKRRVSNLRDKGINPTLGIVIVGDDPASEGYISQKIKAGGSIGVQSEVYRIAHNSELPDLVDVINRLNQDDMIHGILVHLPLRHLYLPPPLELRTITYKIMETIEQSKDVDGLHPINAAKFGRGQPCLPPATAKGIVRLLEYYNIPIERREVVIAGFSEIVGKPLSDVLVSLKGATLTTCTDKTPDVREYSRRADVFISAIGRARYFGADSIKEGAVVIDVGINRVDDSSAGNGFKLVGDFDESIWGKAGYATHVPGGVGPMTVACLLENLVVACENKTNDKI